MGDLGERLAVALALAVPGLVLVLQDRDLRALGGLDDLFGGVGETVCGYRRNAGFRQDLLADLDVEDRDAGILAEQVVVRLGDMDVANHRGEHGLAGRVRLGRIEALESALDVRRKHFQRPDVERLGRFLDLLRVYLHACS